MITCAVCQNQKTETRNVLSIKQSLLFLEYFSNVVVKVLVF